MRVRLYRRLDQGRPTDYQVVRDVHLPGFSADEITTWLDRRVEPGPGIDRPDAACVGDVALMHGAHYRRISPGEWERIEPGALTMALIRQRLATTAAAATAPKAGSGQRTLPHVLRRIRWNGRVVRGFRFALGVVGVALLGITAVGAVAITAGAALVGGLGLAGALGHEGPLRRGARRLRLAVSGSGRNVTAVEMPTVATAAAPDLAPPSPRLSSDAERSPALPALESASARARPATTTTSGHASTARTPARSPRAAVPRSRSGRVADATMPTTATVTSTQALIEALWRGCTTVESQRSPLSAALREAVDVVAGEIRAGARVPPQQSFWDNLAVRRRAHADMLLRQVERGERTLLPKEQGVLDVNVEHFDRAFGLPTTLTPSELLDAARAGGGGAAHPLHDELTPTRHAAPGPRARVRAAAGPQQAVETRESWGPAPAGVSPDPPVPEPPVEGAITPPAPELGPEPPPELRAPF